MIAEMKQAEDLFHAQGTLKFVTVAVLGRPARAHACSSATPDVDISTNLHTRSRSWNLMRGVTGALESSDRFDCGRRRVG